MYFPYLILRLSKSITNIEMKFISTATKRPYWTTSMTIYCASINFSIKSSFCCFHSFINMNIILAKDIWTTFHSDHTYLMSLMIEYLNCWPFSWTKTNRTILTPWKLSLNFISIAPMTRNYFWFIGSTRWCATFLTVAIIMLFYVSYFLTIFPNNIWVSTYKKCNWRG